jgi:hypothetical protein
LNTKEWGEMNRFSDDYDELNFDHKHNWPLARELDPTKFIWLYLKEKRSRGDERDPGLERAA